MAEAKSEPVAQQLQEQPPQQQPGTSSEQKTVKSKRLFVGNVAKSVDQTKFREHFEKFGELKDVVLMKHRDETQHRSFGFVHFVDEADADRVLAMEHNLDGRTLNINNATKRTKKNFTWGAYRVRQRKNRCANTLRNTERSTTSWCSKTAALASSPWFKRTTT